jgi:hypothetical protein
MHRTPMLTPLAAVAMAALSTHVHAWPSDIKFDGHCDGISNIRTEQVRDGTGGKMALGTWNRDACGLPSTGAVGMGGREGGHNTIVGNYDTQALGIAPVLLRLDEFNRWVYVDADGHLYASGTWSPGVPGATAAWLQPSWAGVGRARLSSRVAPEYPSDLPRNIRFDGHCDGLTDIDSHGSYPNRIVTATWNVSACGLLSSTFVGLRQSNRGSKTAIGTYDTFAQGLGYPSLNVEIKLSGSSWTYRDVDGNVVNSGTWTAGVPVPGGSVSVEP